MKREYLVDRIAGSYSKRTGNRSLWVLCLRTAVVLFLSCCGVRLAAEAAEETTAATSNPPAADSAAASLPFAWDVTEKESPWWGADHENRLFDCGFRQVVIDGEVWFMHVKWQDLYLGNCRVMRYKGPDLDHLERQPDGAADLSGAHGGGFLGVGLWWDEPTRTLYTLIHTECEPIGEQGWCTKKTRMAMSQDMGLTWSKPVDVLTRALPNTQDYAGSSFEMGPADFDFYTDVRGGYFYVTCWNGFVAKKGQLNSFVTYNEVARCAIADKMAPGKWFKFCNGTWTEPGLGGKASRVGFSRRGIYGNTIYSTYLQKYLRIGILMGIADKRFAAFGFRDASLCISACSDLAKQDWLPMAKLFDQPDNELFATVLADEKGVDPSVCGQTLRAYNFWDWRTSQQKDRVLTITLKEGSTPSRYFPPYDSYTYEPHPESGDPIESRKTRIVGSADPNVQYDGDGWTVESSEHYYQGQASTAARAGQSIRFTFRGSSIYWRAAAGPDAGRADVYIDEVLQQTVDCFFPECALPYPFAFVQTGLTPQQTHTIKIVVRGDKNPGSSGTIIRHIAFEYGK
ncbi:MAG: hypothetical protein BWY71_00059 [Planctomycetes bacterium ADurb.Bin412]|nr:MAG: hypothetical protein BWY71_00059 [Planctomycetes bacterium ADurb.Bin412]